MQPVRRNHPLLASIDESTLECARSGRFAMPLDESSFFGVEERAKDGRRPMERQIQQGDNWMNRRYPEGPMVGVGGVVVKKNTVLLVQRGKEPGYGEWSLPGGLVELGETLEQAVRREIREETGVRVSVIDLIAALDRVIPDGSGRIEYHYVLLDFLCEWEDGEPAPDTDAMNCAFVGIDDLERYSLTRGAEEVIRRAFVRERDMHFPVYEAGR
jgi:8-oxo-dGTP diphosphatase